MNLLLQFKDDEYDLAKVLLKKPGTTKAPKNKIPTPSVLVFLVAPPIKLDSAASSRSNRDVYRSYSSKDIPIATNKVKSQIVARSITFEDSLLLMKLKLYRSLQKSKEFNYAEKFDRGRLFAQQFKQHNVFVPIDTRDDLFPRTNTRNEFKTSTFWTFDKETPYVELSFHFTHQHLLKLHYRLRPYYRTCFLSLETHAQYM